MENILVATDFSARSDRALRRAMHIARRRNSVIYLLHVVDGDQPHRLIESDHSLAALLLAEAASTLTVEDRLSSKSIVTVGDVDSAVLETADDIGADLIIMGPHRKRIRDVFTGTVVERVLRRAERPLLIAAEPPIAPYQKVLLALDFDEASKSAGRAAVALGIFENMDVVVMHAFDTPAAGMLRRSMLGDAVPDYVEEERQDAANKMHDLAGAIGLPSGRRHVVAVNGTPARTILEAAQGNGAELVVMGANQRKGFECLLIGSVAQDVIRNGMHDILIVPDKGI
ncbi:universal stress protein [Sphingomonas sp. S1-29]|uniref:universal stress protein n=1 Tax=Sphingomonas sp. S1-29 TaxID=2991074 RepID=UPI002240AA78|nr:universal stress protein [Sphingomonas sp. S1-29]UZK68828.1 universal stress protein [Sphingomonas sp. S1-29]